MPSLTNQASSGFSSLFKLSLGLALISLALTFNHSYGWSWKGNLGWWALPLGIVLAAVLFWLPVVLVSHKWLRLPSFYSLVEQLHALTRDFSWSQILVLSALAGIGEELVFRGFVQSWLTNIVGVYTAIALSSLIFALLHAMTRYYFFFTLVASLVFGILFHLSQSMLLLVTVHAVYDVVALGIIAKYPHLLGLNNSHERTDSHAPEQNNHFKP